MRKRGESRMTSRSEFCRIRKLGMPLVGMRKLQKGLEGNSQDYGFQHGKFEMPMRHPSGCL